MHRLICRALGLFILLSLSLAAFAQTAQFSGRVTDPSQALVRGADVRVVNQATGVERRIKTNADGAYTVPFVAPGAYQVFVQANGFSTAVSETLTLTVGQVLVFDVQLKVGSEKQEVTVDAGSQILNTTDASVGTVIDRKFVENIPLNGRSFQDLISMTPGVVTQSPQAGLTVGNGGDFSMNGQRTESNQYIVDGVSENISGGAGNGRGAPANGGVLSAGTALGTTQSLVSVDALQEFKVQSSTYSAEYGRAPGGQFSFATRSGTNELHGSAFDYLRNNFFDANDWFNDDYSKPTSPLRQNDFGGTLGGPIVIPWLYDGRQKSFFFVSYEGLRLTQPQASQIQYVPDISLRTNAPAALQPILNAFPVQNGTDYLNGLAQFISPYSLPGSINSTSVRLDHTFGPRLALFFRFSDTPTSTATRSLSVLNHHALNTTTYTLGATGQITPEIINELRIGYAKSDSLVTGTIDAFGGATPIDLASTMGIPSTGASEPYILINISGTGSSSLVYSDSSTKSHQWNLTDTTSFVISNHRIKAGIDYLKMASQLMPASPLALAEYLNQQSVLTNSAGFAEAVNTNSAQPLFNETAAFLQDEWRIHPRLNLSLGLRWEIMPPPSAANGKLPYTLQGNVAAPSTLSLAPQGTELWKTTWFNFAPRLGIAWEAHSNPGWETVLRTGGGVFFDSDNEEATSGYNGIGFSGYKYPSSYALPFTPDDFNFSLSPVPPYTGSSVIAFPNHLQLPYALEWNASLQQAVGKAQAVTVSYVASNGRRLVQQQQISLHSFNPNFGTVILYPSGVTSSYNALQVQFQRTVRHGVQALASYTWSHSIDVASTASAIPLSRGNSDFDVRNNFSGGLSWELPTVAGNNIVDAVLNHWSLDGRLTARTGFPVPLQGSQKTDPTTGNVYYSGVNLVVGQPIYLYGMQCANLPSSRCPGGRVINKAAFTSVTGVGAGTAPRNFVRGFGETQVNLAARRDFPLYENFTLQFRAEAFNILNHPNFGYIDPALTDLTFGQATKMLNQSLGTVASQYQQGGPRSMQFALKLLF